MADLKYKVLDHPSDVGIIAFGKDRKEIFENAAFGMFSLMADLGSVECELSFDIEEEADDVETLLIEWLNELIYLEDSKKILLKEFKIEELSDKKIKAKVFGEKINLDKHSLYRPIKAATYNQLLLTSNQARIVFDV